MPKDVKEQGGKENNIQAGPKSDQLLHSEDPSSGIPVEIQRPAALSGCLRDDEPPAFTAVNCGQVTRLIDHLGRLYYSPGNYCCN